MQVSPKVAAAVSSLLFASTLGVLIAVASFGIIRMFEQMGEGLSLVPARWGENNPGLLVQISVAIAFPVVIWFVIWFYNKAVLAEQALQNYRYTPPEAPHKHVAKK
jgi:hypothetical protein